MNGVHDMGGMDGFGKVEAEQNEPPFHETWEGRVLAMQRAMGYAGAWHIDDARYAQETLPPHDLSRRVLLLALGARHGEEPARARPGDADELKAGHSLRPGKPLPRKLTKDVVDAGMTRNSFFRQQQGPARFKPGDRVRTRNINPLTHTRLPRYARDKVGTVELIHGCHAFPDSVATDRGDDPQWLYTVVFDGREIWGPDADPTLTVSIDAFEPYLEPADMTAIRPRDARPVGARHPERRRRPGVPRAVGGAGLRHGAGAAQARPVHLAGMGGDARRRDQAGAGGGRSRHRRDLLSALAQRPRTAGRREGHRRRAACWRAITTPGTTPPTARRTAIRSSSGRRDFQP